MQHAGNESTLLRRIPLRKQLGFILSIVICFLLAGALVQNWRTQHQTQEQLQQLQREVQQKDASVRAAGPAAPDRAATASPSAAPVVLQSGTALPTEYAQKHQQVLEVMDAGWKLINQRKPEAARHAADLFQAGIDKIDARSPDLYNGLGRALLIAGKPREAIAAWRAGLKLEPRFAEMQSGIGWAYWHLHDPFHAKKAWDAAIAIDPKCVDAWSALAWIDLAIGDQQASKGGFQVLLAFDRNNTSWIMGLSMAKAGNKNVEEIQHYFPLPALESFQTSVPDPALAVATTIAP